MTKFKITTYSWNPNSLIDCSYLDSHLVEAINSEDFDHEYLGKYQGLRKSELIKRLYEHYQIEESELFFV